MKTHSVREEIVEMVNKLFIYTDNREWKKLQTEIFTGEVDFDMSSVGGENRVMTSHEICAIWAQGFEGIDAVNHLAGNYIVDSDGLVATVFAYATATHFKAAAVNGKTREFVGTYDIGLWQHNGVWKIDKFRYTLKYADGNLELL